MNRWVEADNARIVAEATREPMVWTPEVERGPHCWETYVGWRVRAVWATLQPVIQVAIALDANERAQRENWD
jgi:hypothetical protein